MRALILRHGTVNRRMLLGFSPMGLIWLAFSLKDTTAALLAGMLLALLLAALITLSHEALDPNLERFLLSLPVSRTLLVSETYLSGLAALILGQSLPLLMVKAGHALAPSRTQPLDGATLGVAALIFGTLACLVFFMLPFRFALGGQKGLMLFSITLIALLAGLFVWKGPNGIMDAVNTMGNQLLDHPLRGLMAGLGVVAFGALSLTISVRTYGRIGSFIS
jgi:hypothetical protein